MGLRLVVPAVGVRYVPGSMDGGSGPVHAATDDVASIDTPVLLHTSPHLTLFFISHKQPPALSCSPQALPSRQGIALSTP